MKQTRLSFARVSGPVPTAPPRPLKRSRSPEPQLGPESSVRPAKQSRTATELANVTRSQAAATIARLRAGYRDKSGAGYPAALTNEAGCVLVQKTPNRAVSLGLQTDRAFQHTNRGVWVGQWIHTDCANCGSADPISHTKAEASATKCAPACRLGKQKVHSFRSRDFCRSR